MIKTDKLRGLMAENHVTQELIANKIGISSKTFRDKMKKGVFGSDEIEVMIQVLHIKDPMSIFFAHE